MKLVKPDVPGLQEYLDKMPLYCLPSDDDAIVLNWAKPGVGFGEMTFYYAEVDGIKTLHCDNEGMSKAFLKEMLCTMIDDCEIS